jgi:hypothetical protein
MTVSAIVVAASDHDSRRHDFWKLAHRQQRQRDQTCDDDDDRQHRRKDRSIDEEG